MKLIRFNPSDRYIRLPHPFPFLFAVVSVTALVATNQGEGIEYSNLVVPLSLALITALVGWGLGCILSRDRAGQGIVALAFVLPTLMAGYLFGWTERFFQIAVALPLQVSFSALLFVAAVLLVRQLEVHGVAARFLNVMSLLLLAFTLPPVLGLAGDEDYLPPAPSIPALEAAAARPDIYLVVLDAYSGTQSMATVYDFDNSAVLDSLRRRDFRIPTDPAANYTKTFLSVGSMLNRGYLTELADAAAPTYKDREPAYRALELNQTIADLKYLGYEFFYVGSSYPPMAGNRLADGDGPRRVSRKFEATWLSTSLLRPLLFTWCRLRGCPVNASLPFKAESAGDTEMRIERFLAASRRPGPKLVFMHLLLPHDPLRFGPDCEHRDDDSRANETDPNHSTAKRLYVEQVQCTNRKILTMVDEIRKASGDSAVILLQSDHGYSRFPRGIPLDLHDASRDQIDERFDVFAAYAGPDGLADSLATVRTPVNLFRTLFRVMWSVKEPPLPDRHFWSNPGRPMELIEIDLDAEELSQPE